MKRSEAQKIVGVLADAGELHLARLMVKAGQLKGPGVPDGTGPNQNSPACLVNRKNSLTKKGIVVDIEKETVDNTDFRRVLYTGEASQLVLMSLKSGEDIGEEIHKDSDQFFRIDKGTGIVEINGTKHAIKDGSAFVIPRGVKHNVIAGREGLKLYSIYSPPHHEDGTVHKTKEEALKDDEHFDGKTSE